MTIVFSDNFTVASDTPLESYNTSSAGYTSILNGNNLIVNSATGRVFAEVDSLDIIYRLTTGLGNLTGDYSAAITTSCGQAGAGGYVTVRNQANGSCYDLDLGSNTGQFRLWKSVAGTFTQVATFTGPSIANATEFELKLKVTGTNPVVLEGFVNGVSVGTFNDSAADRLQTGTPGFGVFRTSGNNAAYVTSFSVDDLFTTFQGSAFQYWNGSAWALGRLKKWNGSAWEAAQVQRWNGSTWVNVP